MSGSAALEPVASHDCNDEEDDSQGADDEQRGASCVRSNSFELNHLIYRN